MTGRENADEDERSASSEVPWHNRTPEVLGVSLLAVLVIGLVVFAVSFLSRQFSAPEEAPLNFVDPTFSVSATGSATTTTQTITSTSPPLTSDINTPDPSSTTTSSSATSESETTAEEEETREEESTERTTRRGPRTNVTRTLYPRP